MPKYKTGNYIQISRKAFKMLEDCKTSTKWLYIVLNELEHKFTGHKKDFFFRSIDDLSLDTELSRPTVILGLQELKSIGLVETWQAHWTDKKGRKSEKHVTAIRMLEV